MKAQIKVFVAVLATLTVLVATVFTAFAGGPQWRPADGIKLEQPSSSADLSMRAKQTPLQADKCPDMEAMQVTDPALWFATDEDQVAYPDVVVDSYPTGTNTIAAGFEYKCMPKGSKFAIVFKYGGFDTEPWVTANYDPPPINRPYVFYWSVTSNDKSTAFTDGDYEVEFYWNEKLLTQGEVTLGEKQGPGPNPGGKQVTVQGTVLDGKSKKPIKGALFFVLEPGLTAQEWIDADFPKDKLYTTAESDAQGSFECDRKLDRNVTYSVLVGAKGYKSVSVDDFMIGDQEADPVSLTIKLYK